MKVINCEKNWSDRWDDFVKKHSQDFGLLQSWFWGEFQLAMNKKIVRLAVIEDEKIQALALLIVQPLKLGKSYYYCPRGPIYQEKKALDLLFNEIGSLAEKNNIIFFRFDPAWSEIQQKKLISVGQVQPKNTLILDLSLSEAELLSKMKAKTRYNIKLAEKNVFIDEGEKYFDEFWRLMQQTSNRQEIKPHSKNYYLSLLKELNKNSKLVVAKFNDKVIAANLMVFFGDWCVYLHGASDYNFREKMAPYLLQWQEINKAKEQGFKYYDFWGVDEIKWPGVTRFKKGFGPNIDFTSYVGAYDYVYNVFWYRIYNLTKKFVK